MQSQAFMMMLVSVALLCLSSATPIKKKETVIGPEDGVPPGRPNTITLVRTTSSSLVLEWNPPNDHGTAILGYKLAISPATDDGEWNLVYTGPDRQFKVEGLAAGMEYKVRLQAFNHAGDGHAQKATFSTRAAAPKRMAPPGMNKATENSLDVEWRSATFTGVPLRHYALEVTDSKRGKTRVFNTSATRIVVDNLQPDTKYTLQLRAINVVGSGEWSEAVSYVTKPLVHVDAPSEPTVEARHRTSIKMRWTPPGRHTSPISHYRLEMAAGDSGEFDEVYNGTALVATISDLSPASKYVFRVEGICQNGAHAFSNPKTVTTTW